MSFLHTLLSPDQLRAIDEAPLFAGDRHPAWSALFQEQASATDFLTRKAADALARLPDERKAMRDVIERAASTDNLPDAAAALAELRAFGGMLEAGMHVQTVSPGGKRGATPDFLVDAGDGQVTVEAHARHEAGAQTEFRQAVAEGRTLPGVERRSEKFGNNRVTFTTSVVYPGGEPNPDNRSTQSRPM